MGKDKGRIIQQQIVVTDYSAVERVSINLAIGETCDGWCEPMCKWCIDSAKEKRKRWVRGQSNG